MTKHITAAEATALAAAHKNEWNKTISDINFYIETAAKGGGKNCLIPLSAVDGFFKEMVENLMQRGFKTNCDHHYLEIKWP